MGKKLKTIQNPSPGTLSILQQQHKQQKRINQIQIQSGSYLEPLQGSQCYPGSEGFLPNITTEDLSWLEDTTCNGTQNYSIANQSNGFQNIQNQHITSNLNFNKPPTTTAVAGGNVVNAVGHRAQIYGSYGVQRDTPHPSTSLVSQYPITDYLPGLDNFKVDFSQDSTRVITEKSESGKNNLFTKRREAMTVLVSHSRQGAVVRFYVVFSNPSEITTPVHPCKNDLDRNNPNHFITVEGVLQSTYETEPHPSVVVVPTPVNSRDSSCGTYRVQLKALCRNSCLTRKDLTLVVQLEIYGQVLGRESFELKVSACPRRDYIRLKKIAKGHRLPKKSRAFRQSSTLPEFTENVNMPEKIGDPNAFFQNDQLKLPSEADCLMFKSAMKDNKPSLLASFMAQKFQALHPTEYEEAKILFSALWENNVRK